MIIWPDLWSRSPTSWIFLPSSGQYTGSGSDAYHPRMLLALLFYSYARGTFSSRKIETASFESVPTRYVAGNQHPDHDTICTFRRRFLEPIGALFTQILMIAAEMDMVALGDVSIDGTKIKANASKHKAMSWKRACALEDQLSEEVAELLAAAEAADGQAGEGEQLPEELARRQERLGQIKQAKAMIAQRAEARYEAERGEHEQKMATRAEKEQCTGKKTPGRTPQPPEPGPRDKQQLQPVLDNLQKRPPEIGTPKRIVADNGYYSEDNVNETVDRDLTPYLATGRQKHNPRWDECRGDPGPPPDDPSPLEAMVWRLSTVEGKEVYGRRKATVETVFGIIKQVIGFRQFLLRGLRKAAGEWKLIQCAYNLKRMHALGE